MKYWPGSGSDTEVDYEQWPFRQTSSFSAGRRVEAAMPWLAASEPKRLAPSPELSWSAAIDHRLAGTVNRCDMRQTDAAAAIDDCYVEAELAFDSEWAMRSLDITADLRDSSIGPVYRDRGSPLIVLCDDASTNHPQQGVVTHRHHQSRRERCRRSAAERQTKMVDDRIEPLSTATVTSQHALIELFAEDAATAQDGVAPKATRHNLQFYAPSAQWQVRRPAQVSALNTSALSSAVGTSSRGRA